MSDARATSENNSSGGPLRICPDCGGILDPTQPKWTTMVSLVAGTGEVGAGSPAPPSEVSGWQCLICGYKS